MRVLVTASARFIRSVTARPIYVLTLSFCTAVGGVVFWMWISSLHTANLCGYVTPIRTNGLYGRRDTGVDWVSGYIEFRRDTWQATTAEQSKKMEDADQRFGVGWEIDVPFEDFGYPGRSLFDLQLDKLEFHRDISRKNGTAESGWTIRCPCSVLLAAFGAVPLIAFFRGMSRWLRNPWHPAGSRFPVILNVSNP